MKRSLQEVVELVVFGLIALLIGTGVLWLLGWVLGLVGLLFKVVAGLIWWLLRFIVPVAIVVGLVYFLVRLAQNQGTKRPAPVTPPVPPVAYPPTAGVPTPPANPTPATDPMAPGATASGTAPATPAASGAAPAAPDAHPHAAPDGDRADGGDRAEDSATDPHDDTRG